MSISRIVEHEFKRYRIHQDLNGFRSIRAAYRRLAPPNLYYKHFELREIRREYQFKHKARAGQFELANAWWLMQAALLAFAEHADAQPIYQAAGFKVDFIEHESTSTQCYLLEKADFAILVFRGTQVKPTEQGFRDIAIDIMTDINIGLKKHLPGGKVHTGFAHSFQAIQTELDKRLAMIMSRPQPPKLWFTGHSLGGALATISASHYLSLYKEHIQGLYTFGSPRVGNGSFRDMLEDELPGRIFRIVHRDDLITKIPFADLKGGNYRHVGQLKFIDNDSELIDNPSFVQTGVDELRSLSSNLLSGLTGLLTSNNPYVGSAHSNVFARMMERVLLTLAPTGIPNHAPIYYAIKLWANLEVTVNTL